MWSARSKQRMRANAVKRNKILGDTSTGKICLQLTPRSLVGEDHQLSSTNKTERMICYIGLDHQLHLLALVVGRHLLARCRSSALWRSCSRTDPAVGLSLTENDLKNDG